VLDLKALELVKGSFVDPQLREYHSDLLYRLRLKDGEPALAYILLEHKRHPKRSHRYNCSAIETLLKQEKDVRKRERLQFLY